MSETATMTIDVFKSTAEFLALTEKMRLYVLSRIRTGEPEAAARETYPRAAENPNVARVLAFKLEASPRVQKALAKFHGLSDREIFLQDLDQQIKHAKPGERAPLLALKARVLLGIDAPVMSTVDAGTFTEAEKQAQCFPIGATIEQDGKKYLVTAQEIA